MRNILLFPLRLCVGWGLSPRLLGLIGATMLVLLRLTVGWHFYSEGLDKYQKGNWDAAPFFANARGPLADHFQKLVWDSDGNIRRDMDQSMLYLAMFRDQVANHYGFDEKQINQAQKNYATVVELQQQVFVDYKQDLDEYDLGALREEAMDADPMRDGVASLRGQRDTIRRERVGKLKPALAEISQLWENYEANQNAVATPAQQEASGYLQFEAPLGMHTGTINRFVPYFDIAVGLCLLLGFFTPVAALAAAGFLGSVFLSQYPPVTGPASSNYQLIECMACLVLAGTAAGRFAGLDYFLHLIIRKTYGHRVEVE
ncbi:DoxX family protein [Planctomycetes bacterium K23_9]|uniref:DoxX family protein n=1 Tax=Stieleria marina TaxID=1930275 RepID=UPI0011A07C46